MTIDKTPVSQPPQQSTAQQTAEKARQQRAYREQERLEAEAKAERMKNSAYKAEVERKEMLSKEFTKCVARMEKQTQNCYMNAVGRKYSTEGCREFQRDGLNICNDSYLSCEKNPKCDADGYSYLMLKGLQSSSGETGRALREGGG